MSESGMTENQVEAPVGERDAAENARHPMAPVADRRRAPRLKSLLTGTIICDDLTSTLDCTVRNISAWGAKVTLPDAFRVPDDFNLVVPHHDQTHRAKVIWRKGDSAGLALSDVEEHALKHKKTPREAALERRKAMLSAIY
jgi:PilZ domain